VYHMALQVCLQKYYSATACKILLLSVALSFGYACNRDDGKPRDLLSQQVMSEIIVDQLLVESFASQEGMALGISPIVLLDSVLYPALYAKHKVTSDVYRRSLTYYENDPKRLKAMILDAISILEVKDSLALDYIPRVVPLPELPRNVSPDEVQRMMKKRLGGGATLREE
jgi:hypothetical protein